MAATPATDEFALVAPALYQYNDKTSRELPLLENVARGDVLKLTPTGYRKAAAGERGVGIGIKTGRAGQAGYDFAVVGEAEGFTSLPTGSPLFPSPTVGGGLDTSAVAGFTPQVVALSPTKIRFNFLT